METMKKGWSFLDAYIYLSNSELSDVPIMWLSSRVMDEVWGWEDLLGLARREFWRYCQESVVQIMTMREKMMIREEVGRYLGEEIGLT